MQKQLTGIRMIRYLMKHYNTDFKGKADIFNNFFPKLCTVVNNTSKLPTDSLKITNNCLPTVSFTKDDIAKIRNNIDPNKAHGHEMISIHMLKMCGESILKSLELIENFPSNGKKLMLSRFIKK